MNIIKKYLGMRNIDDEVKQIVPFKSNLA
jgi:hypothetical protein